MELSSKPIPLQSYVLLEDFWPFNNWRTNYEHGSIPIVVDVDPEDPIILPYCDPKNMHPSLSTIAYTPFHDLFVGNLIFVWHVDLTVYPMWMGRAESDVVRDQENENYKNVYVQWWVPMRKGAKNDEELYHTCWLNKYKCNHIDPKQWVEISCVTFSFLTRSNITINSMISINATHAFKAKTNLDVAKNNSFAL